MQEDQQQQQQQQQQLQLQQEEDQITRIETDLILDNSNPLTKIQFYLRSLVSSSIAISLPPHYHFHSRLFVNIFLLILLLLITSFRLITFTGTSRR